jgi:hypothetical protein
MDYPFRDEHLVCKLLYVASWRSPKEQQRKFGEDEIRSFLIVRERLEGRLVSMSGLVWDQLNTTPFCFIEAVRTEAASFLYSQDKYQIFFILLQL